MTEARRVILLAPGAVLSQAAALIDDYDVVDIPPAQIHGVTDVQPLVELLEERGASEAYALVVGDEIFPPAQSQDESLTAGMRMTFQVTKSMIRGMMRRRTGRIVGCAPRLNDARVPHNAAVDSLSGFMRSVAREVGSRGITANVMVLGEDGGEQAPLSPYVAVGRRMEPSDAVGILSFFLSQSSGYVTGRTIWLDGGLALG